jgi:hypothetical protein
MYPSRTSQVCVAPQSRLWGSACSSIWVPALREGGAASCTCSYATGRWRQLVRQPDAPGRTGEAMPPTRRGARWLGTGSGMPS